MFQFKNGKEPVFKLRGNFSPAGDQPRAIAELLDGLRRGMKKQTLLGATGTGKTFTIANVIASYGRPALVIAHNKTLAAQLASEFREFFPEAAVHYFVSYYDYYQPEAYLPVTDTYIEKDAQINKEIDRLRHATTQALLTRPDVIIVASVSCIYGLGSPEEYERVNLKLEAGMKIDRRVLLRRLVGIHFERTNSDLTPGTFRSVGRRVDIMPVSETFVYQVELGQELQGSTLEKILKIDPVSSRVISEERSAFIFPAKHFITEEGKMKRALSEIKKELDAELKRFEKRGKLLEAERLRRRTNYDIAMMREVGYCSGIENYSRHLSGKAEGEPPETLLSYFPEDFLTIIDESHVTLPQLRGMYAGDASRKATLVEHGFRLPSARDNRPLRYEEFEDRVGSVIYTSATPGEEERHESKQIVEQIIRPTGLVDPEIFVRPVSEGAPVGSFSQVLGSPRRELALSELKARPDHSKKNPPGRRYPGQISDFLKETEETVQKGFRALATTLTKKMAEDLAAYLKDKKIKAEYLHSDIKTIERIKILTDFRKGKFDVLVGVNLLREGLDLPEVALIGVFDADKEGFLRSETSLIQIIGRAARNTEGRVILYADNLTGSMKRAIKETNRRRNIQLAYNREHGITPRTISKNIKDITEELENKHARAVSAELALDVSLFTRMFSQNNQIASTAILRGGGNESELIKNTLLSNDKRNKRVYKKIIKIKEREMNKAVKELDFETAAILRDEILVLKKNVETA